MTTDITQSTDVSRPTDNTNASGFLQFDFKPQLMRGLSDLGYSMPTPVQEKAIPILLRGSDVIAQALTGTGKTAAFMLPILQTLKQGQNGVQVLVMVPTRELALQVAQATLAYGNYLNVDVLAVYGGQPYSLQIGRLRKGIDIVVGTPGRLLDLIQKKELDLSSLSAIVLDEADEMLSMGFIQDIEEILSSCPSERQTALFSATLSPKIVSMAKKYMHAPQSVIIPSRHLTVDAIDHRYCLVNQKDKLAVLTRLFEIEDITSALIFANTRISTSALVNELMERGFPAEALNGDLAQTTREHVLNRFRRNQTTVLVATDVAARGLDIDDISHVFNYDLPLDPESYVHRVGRTGRADKTGIAVSLVTPQEQWRLHRIEGYTKQSLTRVQIPGVEEIEEHREAKLLAQMNGLLKRGRCQKELQLVTRLVEMGHDPIKIAATALKIVRAEEKQRPIAEISQVKESGSSSPWRKTQRDKNGKGSSVLGHPNERGMVRLTLSAGRSHGVQPGDIVRMIARQADFPGSNIGAIRILNDHTLIDIPQQFVQQTLANASKYRIRNNSVTLTHA
ncbi:MAG: DEAD/DEAH box helicase [Dehalococcoidales bacterium]|jgi:ATP-dependent RNA helicase DeaD|nr:DEAD/DEAH box helicase [Dehalococcoidales bacterium]MDD5605201.1 DEAD/DEAH box helicase [Dehalococcoidales bacterium]MDX9986236.1 DEAD/DEAH box helicase [Dehalococcoidales bacterium]NLE90327.1 DEAD/DEAH box helicase [Dehalococcoidales bacterium]